MSALLSPLLALYTLWILYLAVMSLATARNIGKLPRWALWLGYPLLAAGYIMDFLVNITLLSVIMLEVPQELLVTARLTRHINGTAGWRKSFATWVCQNLLDFADPSGCHCKKHED